MIPPSHLGPYVLEAELGRGAMGVVYRARDSRVDRLVAIKLVLAERDGDARRFEVEARAAGRLRHKNLVAVHDLAREGQRLYLVSEFVQGQSLRDELRQRGRFEAREAAELIARLCDAVEHAHQEGVLHRDIKPENVLLEGDEPRLTDFGLARLEASDLTTTGQLLGTPSYMPPEQASGERHAVDPRSDVYSLGATLYALLTGRPPFSEASLYSTLTAVLTKHPPAPSSLAPVPPGLETITLTALAKEPAERFQSAAAFGTALRDWQAGTANKAVLDRQKRTKLWVASVGALSVLLAGSLAAWALSRGAEVAPPTLAPRQDSPSPLATPAPDQGQDPEERAAALWNDLSRVDGDAALAAYTKLAETPRGKSTKLVHETLVEILVAGHGTDAARARAVALLEAPASGSTEAGLRLANVLTRGRSANLEKAQRLCQRLAQEGQPRAWALLADLYLELGKKVAARKAYETSTEQGYTEARVRLGNLLLQGGPEELKKGRYALRLSIREGYAPAKVALGYVYLNGIGVPVERSKANQLFYEASQLGVPEGDLALSVMADEDHKAEALANGRKALELGHAPAALHLAKLLETTPGAEEEVLGLLRYSASRGDEEGLIRLSRLHLTGKGTPRDEARGLALLQRAAKRGSVRAELEFGRQLHVRGRTPEARASWRRAAALGQPEAISKLGHSLLKREPKAIEEASTLLHQAAKLLDPDASRTLAAAYATGESSLGLERNLQRALEHYQRLKDSGDQEALQAIKRIKRELAEENETP